MQIYKVHKKQNSQKESTACKCYCLLLITAAQKFTYYRYFLLLHVTDMITLLTGLDAGG